MVKKRTLRSPPSAVASISNNAFFLLDTHTGLQFLIDTDACRSLLPKSKVHSGCITGNDTNLIAANGSHILTYGYKALQLSFAGSKYKWGFIMADVSTPIISADFLANFNLLVDIEKGENAIEYQDLKAFLLQKFSPSAERRIQMILDLSNEPLGDQRPSDAFTETRSLCRLPPDGTGTFAKIDVLLALWLRRPPPSHSCPFSHHKLRILR